MEAQGSPLQLLKIPETRDKILVTMGLLLAYRLGFQVPIPGMNPNFLSDISREAQQSWFGLMNAFSGGDIGRTSMFSLGIMPYISASIIFSMLSKISPKIEAIAKEGASGQKRINQWTRLLAVPIALLQALLVYTGVFLANPLMIDKSIGAGLGLAVIVILSLTAGAIFCMWLGELITEYGIGNGASLIIMAGIITDMPSALAQMVGRDDFYDTIVYLVALWLAIVVVIVYITKGTRRIPIQYAKLTRGRRVYGGQRHFLPLKVNMAGVMPIIFASIIFVLPGVLLSLLDYEWSTWLATVLNDQVGFVHVALQVVLIFAFCFFWNRLMFQPEQIADDLRERGSFIPGIRPGPKTAEFLDHTLTRITMAGAAFLAVIAVLPSFVTAKTPLTPAMAYFLGGTSVLIVVGVALDVVDKLNAQLVMRNYEGFMKSSGAGWTQQPGQQTKP
ncbi:MAG: preprotein translocase subunit SecY [Planctomycetes bacterium]|nr:preprotein translocase subunit SecY [Planctomycetota bacterium]